MVAEEIHKHVLDTYGITLHMDKLLWGSIAPDIMPFYKFIRHYKEESIGYISKEIVNVIFLLHGKDFREDSVLRKYLSKKLGIISHYLCDYVCYPHAVRMTCLSSKGAKEHLGYEVRLNDFAKDHTFQYLEFEPCDIHMESRRFVSLISQVREFINQVVEEYHRLPSSYEKDLNFAYTLNVKIADFIFETVLDSSQETIIETV